MNCRFLINMVTKMSPNYLLNHDFPWWGQSMKVETPFGLRKPCPVYSSISPDVSVGCLETESEKRTTAPLSGPSTHESRVSLLRWEFPNRRGCISVLQNTLFSVMSLHPSLVLSKGSSSDQSWLPQKQCWERGAPQHRGTNSCRWTSTPKDLHIHAYKAKTHLQQLLFSPIAHQLPVEANDKASPK